MINYTKPCIDVRHTDLKRRGDSAYRSVCPVCEEGTLLVYRDQLTFRLVDIDRCVKCAQLVRYMDTIIGGEPVEHINSGITEPSDRETLV
jgi:hypothetical protein